MENSPFSNEFVKERKDKEKTDTMLAKSIGENTPEHAKITECQEAAQISNDIRAYISGRITEVEDIPPTDIEHLRGCESCLKELVAHRREINYSEDLDVLQRFALLEYEIEFKGEIFYEKVREILWDTEYRGSYEDFKKRMERLPLPGELIRRKKDWAKKSNKCHD